MDKKIEGWFEKDKQLYIARTVEEFISSKNYDANLIKAWYKRDNKTYMIELPYKTNIKPALIGISNICPDFICFEK